MMDEVIDAVAKLVGVIIGNGSLEVSQDDLHEDILLSGVKA